MKKKLLIIVILILLVTGITGCNKKENPKGQLIEISSLELSKNIDNNNFILAITDSNNIYNDDYIKDLERTAKLTKNVIYYIDTKHISITMDIFLYEVLLLPTGLSYVVIEDSNAATSGQYEDPSELTKSISEFNYKEDNLEKLTQEEIEENINNSRIKLEEGLVSYSLDYLNMVWSAKEAKEIYDANPIYNLLGTWDNYTTSGEYINYIKLKSYTFSDKIYIYETKGKSGEIKQPEINDYKSYYYLVKDDIIYISESVDGKYKEYAEFVYGDATKLAIIINGKNYTFLPSS